MSRAVVAVTLVVFLAAFSFIAAAQSPAVYSYGRSAAPRGTVISAELKDALRVDRLRVGDKVKLRLRDPIADSGTKELLVPKEASLTATVRHLTAADGTPRLCIVLEDADWDTGSKILNAVVTAASVPNSAQPVNLFYDVRWGNLIAEANLPKGTRLSFQVPSPHVGRSLRQSEQPGRILGAALRQHRPPPPEAGLRRPFPAE